MRSRNHSQVKRALKRFQARQVNSQSVLFRAKFRWFCVLAIMRFFSHAHCLEVRLFEWQFGELSEPI